MANVIRDEDLRLNIIVNGDKYKRELGELEQANRDLRKSQADLGKQISDLDKNDQNYKNTVKQLRQELREKTLAIKANENAQVALKNKIGITGMSMKQLQQEASRLKVALLNATPGTSNFKKLDSELAQVTGRMAQVRASSKSLSAAGSTVGGFIGKVADGFNKYFNMAVAGIAAITGVIFSIKSLITGNSKLSDSFADIAKTTGMTSGEVEELNKKLGEIDTRTGRQELRDMAVVAGQLGISKGDVYGFVESIDKLNVALGDEFTGGAQVIAEEMGKLRLIFRDIKTDDVSADLLHIGNALNELGADGAATGPVVADFANRIGGVGINLGLTTGQVLGLSASLQELNVSTERGGTAMVRILQRMTINTAGFAQVAGMPLKQFTDLVNNDLYGAFMKVVEGTQKSGTSATALAAIIKDLDVDGAGASEVFSKLSKNTELVSQKVDLATKSLKSNDSILNEFNLKNNNLAGNLEKIGKWFNSLFVNSAITNGMQKMVSLFADWIKIPVSEKMEEERIEVNMLVAQITEANITAETRNKLYDKLEAINPKIVEGIDKESVSWHFLQQNLAKYNEEQINRIIIQKQQEKLDEQNAKTADKLASKLEAETKVRKALAAEVVYYEKLSKKTNYTNEERAKFLELSKKIQDINTNTNQGEDLDLKQKVSRATDAITETIGLNENRLRGLYQIVLNYEKDYNEELKKANDLLSEKETLMKELGIGDNSENDVNPPKKNETDKSNSSTAKTEEELKKEQDAIEKQKKAKLEFASYIMELNKELLNNEYEKALAEIDIWYKKEREKIQLSDWSAKEQAKGLELTEQLKNKKIADTEAEFNKKRFEKEKEFMNQITITTLQNEDQKTKITEQMLKTRIEIEKRYAEEKKQLTEQDVQIMEEMVESMTSLMIAFATEQKETMADYAKQTLLLALEVLKNQLELAITGVTIQSLASPESIATYGVAGITKAAIIIGLIESAYGALKSSITNFEGFEQGGEAFQVTRAQDGKLFQAQYTPNKRGYINKPSILVGEYNKPEYVISNEMLKVPAIRTFTNLIDSASSGSLRSLDTNYFIKGNAVRGFETGGYTQQITQQQTVVYSDPVLLQAIVTLNTLLKNGINAEVSYKELKRKEERLTSIIEKTTLK